MNQRVTARWVVFHNVVIMSALRAADLWSALSPLRRLPDLQCRNGKSHANDCHDPKPCHDLSLSITQLLVMMVQGAHQKDPPACTILSLRIAEIGHLDDDTQALNQEDPAEYRDQQFFTDDDGQGCDNAAQRQAPGITHEHLGRESI